MRHQKSNGVTASAQQWGRVSFFVVQCCRALVMYLVLGVVMNGAANVSAIERIVMKRDGKTQQVAGRLLTEAEDGGVMLMTADGAITVVQPGEIVERTKDETPFKPLTQKEAAARLLTELPADFKVHTTAHYLICYNTSPAYAQWCGALFERLYRGFDNYWEKIGVKLHEPEVPLVALVFDSKDAYVTFVRGELGEAANSIVGFYSPTTNRVNMYDLTGFDEQRTGAGVREKSAAHINQLLSQPAAAATVATIVHEATHQLAYNCGLQTRLADNPVWVSEGLAMYFETPDLSNSKGWAGIGTINRGRLLQFRKYLSSGSRGDDSLTTLLQDDKRFRDPQTALNAYAESWAMNYFLLKTRSKDYASYLKQLAAKNEAIYDTPAERIQLFRSVFGNDLTKFDNDFVRYMRRLD